MALRLGQHQLSSRPTFVIIVWWPWRVLLLFFQSLISSLVLRLWSIDLPPLYFLTKLPLLMGEGNSATLFFYGARYDDWYIIA